MLVKPNSFGQRVLLPNPSRIWLALVEVSAEMHQLTTVGIDIGIWVLHLALLQKYRRDSMIASV